ncbi:MULTISPECIES: ABC transporter ATP-binding protein [Peptoniphilus]|uniref:ABC transporter ATP-binding protein n=1 Tax=Peptoniphilus TaxID=162289 RepID=UPI0002890E79|nr:MULTISPECIES: ABC transporter ATP-binding protein [Peptoniphilus]MDU1044176.1 ABC transporter ATP-binding protein [Peptoniphilus rhinitidis]MDU1955194.1 ABC transporter ATP-binding protein [Peptoniphilus lacydonensis]MDU2115995.1 ABC transporter ATP-binding protein [Peptoniphilus lacydonensis]MDU5594593.1 ABC transporter ATP-binding protein [Peptoniphilus rhinitidis]MDU7303026.1 ABC transporter ATP-binding protein [Peptoniphilus lacydonensis]
MNSIEIKNLNKEFKDFELNIENLEIPKGAVIGLIGENGAGKTTFLKCILDLYKYDGEIKIFGEKVHKESFEEIGAVLSNSFFSDNFKVKDVVDILKVAYKNFDEKMFYDCVNRFKMPKNKKLKELSTGNLMKLKIISAICHKPDLLILDEPTSGLDPVIRDEIIEFLFDYIRNDDRTILFSSHILSDIEKIADYIIYIRDGEIIFYDEKDTLIENYGILKTTEENLEDYGDFILRTRKNKYSTEALIKNVDVFKEFYPNEIVDRVNVEDIMIFLSRGAK